MTFEQAVAKMIKEYWRDKGGFETAETFKSAKYNKKYFDGLKEELLGKSSEDYEEKSTKKKKKKGNKSGY